MNVGLSKVTIDHLVDTIRAERGFELVPCEFTSQMILSKDQRNIETLIGPFDIRGTDLRIVVKTTGWYDSNILDGQFILIDCEGDVIQQSGAPGPIPGEAYGTVDIVLERIDL